MCLVGDGLHRLSMLIQFTQFRVKSVDHGYNKCRHGLPVYHVSSVNDKDRVTYLQRMVNVYILNSLVI